MNFAMPDLYPASAEIFILLMACALLLVDVFVGKDRRWLVYLMTQLTLAGCFGITFFTLDGQGATTFSNMFIDDLMADVLKLVLYPSVAAMLVYSRRYLATRNLDSGEFHVLVLFATLGMMVMISASHFLTVYLGLELLALSLYALVAIDRDCARATEAAMKYFVLGAMASGLLLYGMSMVYGAVGSLELYEIGQRIASGSGNKAVLVFGLVFVVAGLAFKLGVVPFHMWVPDVYQGAPTPVTLFIGSAPKLAAFAIVLRMLVTGLAELAEHWQTMLMILAALSIALGNLAAIAQTNLKRMLAYSAISHMGFMLLGLLAGLTGSTGVLDPLRAAINAYSAAMFYAIAYVLMSLGAFGMILLLSRAGFEAENIEDFKGLNKRSPWFAAIMMILMFSMAGVPFFIGFFAKFAVLQAVVAAKHVWLAVFAVLFSLIGAFYYLRVVKVMYFDAPADAAPLEAPRDMRILLSLNGLAVAVLGLLPGGVFEYSMFAIYAFVAGH
jgi:NADH-quinone oxidoreductase subunit N